MISKRIRDFRIATYGKMHRILVAEFAVTGNFPTVEVSVGRESLEKNSI